MDPANCCSSDKPGLADGDHLFRKRQPDQPVPGLKMIDGSQAWLREDSITGEGFSLPLTSRFSPKAERSLASSPPLKLTPRPLEPYVFTSIALASPQNTSFQMLHTRASPARLFSATRSQLSHCSCKKGGQASACHLAPGGGQQERQKPREKCRQDKAEIFCRSLRLTLRRVMTLTRRNPAAHLGKASI